MSVTSSMNGLALDSTMSADRLIETLHSINADTFAPADHQRVKEALLGALRRVQTPFDIAYDHVWTESATTAAVKTLIDVGLWTKWAAAGHKPMTINELASLTSFDPVLLNRLLRGLAGQQLLHQIDADTYGPTAYSKALAEDKFPSLYSFLYGIIEPCFANFPRFAQATAYQNPIDAVATNFASWRGKDQTLFTALRADPDLAMHFNNAMTVYAAVRPSWTNIYPTDEIVAAGTTSGSDSSSSPRKLVVDIGGGLGHDLEKFRAKHPDVPQGSLMLQDQPAVVEKAKVVSPCVAQAYDFFTPEPINGARAYYVHNILHDWPDDKAVDILRNVASAMEKGYSRILLHEIVIEDQNAHPRATLSDLLMMMIFSAGERSEREWRSIISRAGLKITKIWSIPESVESVIEIELP